LTFYDQRGTNVLQTLLKEHLRESAEDCEQKYLDSPDSHETQESHDPDLSVCSAEHRAA